MIANVNSLQRDTEMSNKGCSKLNDEDLELVSGGSTACPINIDPRNNTSGVIIRDTFQNLKVSPMSLLKKIENGELPRDMKTYLEENREELYDNKGLSQLYN